MGESKSSVKIKYKKVKKGGFHRKNKGKNKNNDKINDLKENNKVKGNTSVENEEAEKKELIANPSSVSEFEMLVKENATCADFWTSYMNFYINSGDFESARKTVKRGLESLDFRNMVEKRKLWTSYLKMECAFGDRVMEVFNLAIQYNDSKTMHLEMVDIFVKNGKFDKAEEICKLAIKRFHKSKKVWLSYLRLYYENLKDFNSARELHKTCISRIPDRKKIYITSSTALLEYKFGSAERGKTYFEQILLENPRRMDIWNQYITAHIKLNMDESKTQRSEGLKNVRDLFQRAINLDLKPKKMKIIFSKWLEFECVYGNEKSKEKVQNKAMEYVEYIEKKINS